MKKNEEMTYLNFWKNIKLVKTLDLKHCAFVYNTFGIEVQRHSEDCFDTFDDYWEYCESVMNDVTSWLTGTLDVDADDSMLMIVFKDGGFTTEKGEKIIDYLKKKGLAE